MPNTDPRPPRAGETTETADDASWLLGDPIIEVPTPAPVAPGEGWEEALPRDIQPITSDERREQTAVELQRWRRMGGPQSYGQRTYRMLAYEAALRESESARQAAEQRAETAEEERDEADRRAGAAERELASVRKRLTEEERWYAGAVEKLEAAQAEATTLRTRLAAVERSMDDAQRARDVEWQRARDAREEAAALRTRLAAAEGERQAAEQVIRRAAEQVIAGGPAYRTLFEHMFPAAPTTGGADA